MRRLIVRAGVSLRGRRGTEWGIYLLLGALCAAGLYRRPAPAMAQDPPIVETHRVRIINQAGGKVEVSLDGGRAWETIGHVTRPASVSAVGGRALEAVMPSTVAGPAPESIAIRVPTTLAAPRWIRIAAAGEAPNNAALQTDIAASESLFRPLAPVAGSRVFLEKDNQQNALPTNYLPKAGDRLLIISERSPDAPASVVLENKPGGLVLAVTPLGEEKIIGRVKQPFRGIGRYAGTDRAGQGAVVSYQGAAITVASAGRMRRLDANDQPVDDRGGIVIQPAESDLKGATHPDSQILVEAAATPGQARPVVSPLFGLPVPLSSGVPTDTAPTRVDVRIDGGDWQPFPDFRGGIDAADFGDRLSKALGGKMLKDGITHLRIVPGAPSLASYRYFVRLAAAPRAANGVQRGRVTITANAVGAGIVFVSFLLDGKVARVTNQSPFTWDWDTSRVANGPHLVEIRGADERGTVVNTVVTRILVDN
jgi:hypothetical protein